MEDELDDSKKKKREKKQQKYINPMEVKPAIKFIFTKITLLLINCGWYAPGQ